MDSKNKQEIKQVVNQSAILRDYLAADRTLLAIDRTLLSYIRTSLTMFVAGVSFLKFFDTFFLHALGWFFVIFAVITTIFGLQRCLEANMTINKRNKTKDDIIAGTSMPDFNLNFIVTLKQSVSKTYKSFLLAFGLKRPKD